MKKYWMAVMIVISTISSTMAQYDNRDYAYNDDRFYYDNDFDWHWDIRVRISDGIQRGQLTQYESNMLYRRLEDLERKEYAYQSDGFYTSWEQQEIWDDVVFLNRRMGLELNDYDRNFYGFDVYGYDRRGYPRGYYKGGYDFSRFDKRGFGTIKLGYYPRPNYKGWYRNNQNQTARRYYTERSQYANRGNIQRGDERTDRDRRGGYNNQYPNNGQRGNNDRNRGNQSSGNDRDRYSQESQNRTDRPNNSNERGGYSQGNRTDRPSVEPNNGGNERGGYSQGNRTDRPSVEPNNGGNERGGNTQGNRTDRPSVEPNNRSDNKGGDWNANRGGVNRDRPSGNKGRD